MKKIFLSIIIVGANFITLAQSVIKDSIDINLLNAPSNAAFNLMGVSTSTIDRPTDLNNFRLSIQNATNSFSKFPSNYAVEFSPYAIFAKKDQTLLKFNETNFKDVFQQSLSVSFAITKSNIDDKETNDTLSFTKLGFGFKFSIIRPKWSSNTTKVVDNFYAYQKDLNDAYIELANTLSKSNQRLKDIELQITNEQDPTKIEALIKLQGILRDEIRDSIVVALQNFDAPNKPAAFKTFALAAKNLQKYAHDLKLERQGAFLDFATGIALDFPDNKFNNSLVSKAGAWLTGGYENGNSGFTFMGVGRYLFQPDKLFADDSGKLNSKNISTFDFGARALVSALDGKFTLSSEFIYRSILNDNAIKPSYRFVFNTEYDIGFNQKITFAIGRNFDGTITKTNNLIAALNFIKGFGSNKKL
jgi:hypothetical protein